MTVMKAMVAQGSGKKISERSQKSPQVSGMLWLSSIVFVLSLGWLNRNEGYVNAESGAGYWFGIIGGSMMLLLLMYSVRKRFKKKFKFLKVNFWFKFHMALGVMGPTFIMLHSNYNLGSLNSTVALGCMLIVAGSGLAGRYLYTRIHHGLYGEKIQVKQVTKNMEKVKDEVLSLTVNAQQKEYVEKLFAQIHEFSTQTSQRTSFSSISRHRKKARQLNMSLEKFIDQLIIYYNNRGERRPDILNLQATLRDDTSQLLSSLKRLPGLHFFERMFSLWHIFHIPFFILMIVTAITHVVVVHMY